MGCQDHSLVSARTCYLVPQPLCLKEDLLPLQVWDGWWDECGIGRQGGTGWSGWGGALLHQSNCWPGIAISGWECHRLSRRLSEHLWITSVLLVIACYVGTHCASFGSPVQGMCLRYYSLNARHIGSHILTVDFTTIAAVLPPILEVSA